MKYTAQDESRVANIAQGKAKCSHQELYTFIQQSGSVLKVLLYFYTNLTHLLNKQTGFFDKMCQ